MSSLEQTECPECGQVVHYQPQRWKAQVVCSNCQAMFPVEAMNPPVGNTDAPPIPSHLQGQNESSMPADAPMSEGTPDGESFRYKRSKVGGIVIVSSLMVLLAGGVVAGIVALAMIDSNSKASSRKEKENAEAKEKVNFITAGKKRAKLGDLEVGVKLVEFGPLRVKDQTNKVHVSSDPMLQIHLEIRSRRSSEVDYVSWYGNSFTRGGDQVVAELTDQDGKSCDMPVFEDVKGLFGHTPKATLEKNQRLQDCMIFEIPAGKTITDIQELRLTLPM
ncbi:MAG: hypothetical protein VX768_18860, partial [Planctomycetota bacterium]|nr:hypothetical protein [Planctomycetota bacterium]